MRIASLAATVLVLCGSSLAFAEEGKLNTPPEGFTLLFNGKDLTNWQGMLLDGNPYEIAKLSKEKRAKLQAEADAAAKQDWQVKDGILVFDGSGKSLVTAKDYGDFEFYVDFKIEPKGDSGIYLRGTPQVQIWDPALNNIGSGGLYNNQKNPSKPLGEIADNPVGEWNTFYIKMVGDKVTVKLNGKTVVDQTPLENYWNREMPLLEKGTIELQNHGNTLYFRNIYVREL
jgi:hypothetical protein